MVLDRGRIVERGTHAELLATTPLYAEVLARTTLDAQGADSEAR